jgi:hypothetical protein
MKNLFRIEVLSRYAIVTFLRTITGLVFPLIYPSIVGLFSFFSSTICLLLLYTSFIGWRTWYLHFISPMVQPFDDVVYFSIYAGIL